MVVLGKLEDSVPTLVELLTLLAVTPDDFYLHLDGPSLPLLGMLVFLMFFPVLGSSNARGCSVILYYCQLPLGVAFSLGGQLSRLPAGVLGWT